MEIMRSADLRGDWIDTAIEPVLIRRYSKIRGVFIPFPELIEHVPTMSEIKNLILSAVKGWGG